MAAISECQAKIQSGQKKGQPCGNKVLQGQIYCGKHGGPPSSSTKSKIPIGVKTQVWNKEFGISIGEAKCPVCNINIINQMNFECGHIIAEANGGQVTIDNLRPVCNKCNTRMGTKNMNEYKNALTKRSNPEEIKQEEKQKLEESKKGEPDFKRQFEQTLLSLGFRNNYESWRGPNRTSILSKSFKVVSVDVINVTIRSEDTGGEYRYPKNYFLQSEAIKGTLQEEYRIADCFIIKGKKLTYMEYKNMNYN